MIEFSWELQQVLSGIKKGLLEKQTTKFLRPHDAIWGDTPDGFIPLAESIYGLLPTLQVQRQFLSVCLGSYLLDPRKAPESALSWIHTKTSIADIIGIDVPIEELEQWRWDRAAFPVLDEYENGKNDTIYYALVACSKMVSPHHCPSWISDALNADALDAVKIAAELAIKPDSGNAFFFWPYINPQKPVHDRSLGLPIYLSFLSLAKERPIPPIIATGEINRLGELCPVQGVLNKFNKAFEKKYKRFIYPEDGSRLEKRREYVPVGVTTLAKAQQEWGVSKRIIITDQREQAIPVSPETDMPKNSNQTQAYFDDIQLHILHELGKATDSITIAVAWFTDSEIFELLCQKAQDGVSVKLLITNDQINAKSGLDYNRLRSLGATVEMIGSGGKKQPLMHNKFCVIDAETVITGSYNWTYMAQQHDENITIIKEASELAQQFIIEFNQILKRKKKVGQDTAFDHSKLMARIEALRGVIQAEDDDDIALQLLKLKKLLPVGDEFIGVREIISLVDAGNLDEAETRIVAWLNSNKQVSVWVDPDIYDLKLELKSLEIQISALEDEKADMEKNLHAFQFRYTIELGELLRKILYCRMERVKYWTKDELEQQAAYEKAKRDYDQFTHDCDESSKWDVLELSPELQNELKAKYRRCSKLCHPDVVAPDNREDAKRLFTQLNEANERNDLEAVNRIYENLQKGIFVSASESITDSMKLHREVIRMRVKVSELNTSIRVIRRSESYQKLSAIDDWESYFKDTYTQLEDELKRLRFDE